LGTGKIDDDTTFARSYRRRDGVDGIDPFSSRLSVLMQCRLLRLISSSSCPDDGVDGGEGQVDGLKDLAACSDMMSDSPKAARRHGKGTFVGQPGGIRKYASEPRFDATNMTLK